MQSGAQTFQSTGMLKEKCTNPNSRNSKRNTCRFCWDNWQVAVVVPMSHSPSLGPRKNELPCPLPPWLGEARWAVLTNDLGAEVKWSGGISLLEWEPPEVFCPLCLASSKAGAAPSAGSLMRTMQSRVPRTNIMGEKGIFALWSLWNFNLA